MRNFFPLWGAFLLVCLFGSCAQHTHRPSTAPDAALWVAIGNQGPYPNYWYNLANEYNNAGEVALAMDAYRRCLADCQNQAICNDACYNLSLLCFEQQLNDSGYLLLDTLLARQYTWLPWYANQKQLAVFETPAYQKRLLQIQTLADKRQDPENARFVYEDVDRFVSLFPILQQNWQEAPYLLQTRYFDQVDLAVKPKAFEAGIGQAHAQVVGPRIAGVLAHQLLKEPVDGVLFVAATIDRYQIADGGFVQRIELEDVVSEGLFLSPLFINIGYPQMPFELIELLRRQQMGQAE